jgi:hypothetical protein
VGYLPALGFPKIPSNRIRVARQIMSGPLQADSIHDWSGERHV